MKRFALSIVGLVLVSWTFLSVELEKKALLDGRVEILIPREFTVMSEEMLDLKYPMKERQPTLVYTDASGGINVAFNHTASKASQEKLESLLESFDKMFKNLYPSAEWKGTGVKVVNGKKIGYMELITPAIDTKIYNLIFFTDMDDRLLLCTFNCVEKSMDAWLEPAHEILNSLSIK